MQGRRIKGRTPVLLVLVLVMLLAGCGVAPSRQTPSTLQAQAAALEQEGKYAQAAPVYESLAAQAQGTQQADYLVSAAEDWFLAGNGNQSWKVLGQVHDRNLYPALRARLELVKANLDLASHQPAIALTHLRFPLDSLPAELKARTLLVRGQAYAELGQAADAVSDWCAREGFLQNDAVAIRANHQLIWQLLTQTHAPAGTLALPTGLTPVARGWFELADIARSSWQQPEKFAQRLQDWQSTYPLHPADQDIVPGLLAKQQALIAYPPRIALLLPLSGNYQSAAQAVRDGLLAAYYELVGSGSRSSIMLYDSGLTADGARTAYQQAISDGANMVIGPLTKDGVAGLAALPSLPVPVLALNYLDNGRAPPAGFYQFGLLPEDEAAQAAQRAIAEGYTRGVALVSADDWGTRLLGAFSSEFTRGGGTLLGIQSYTPGSSDYSAPITRLLGLDASEARADQLAGLLSTHLQFEPRRRQDLQFIFLAARSTDAKLIQPQLNFYHALDVPVLATSQVFNPGDKPDDDLDGIRFDDMPWTLEASGATSEIRADIARNWPGNYEGNSRLYALGFDAYRLIPLLYNNHGIAEAVEGMTGQLSLDTTGQIHRRLDWAAFDNGSPRLLAPIAPPAPAVLAAPPPPSP